MVFADGSKIIESLFEVVGALVEARRDELVEAGRLVDCAVQDVVDGLDFRVVRGPSSSSLDDDAGPGCVCGAVTNANDDLRGRTPSTKNSTLSCSALAKGDSVKYSMAFSGRTPPLIWSHTGSKNVMSRRSARGGPRSMRV